MSSQPVPLQPEAEEETRESPSTRSSDRVYLEIPITLRGSDSEGRNFSENTHTLVISRRGAKIISRQPLVPRQLLAIRCNKTGLDAAALVVGPIMGDEEGCHFALAFLHQEEDFWGVSFPLLDGKENAAGRIFLECSTCKAQQVAHLDVFELEVLLANDSLTRPCHRCNRSGLWVRTAPEEERTPPLQCRPRPALQTGESQIGGHQSEGGCLHPPPQVWRRNGDYGKRFAWGVPFSWAQGLPAGKYSGSRTALPPRRR